MIESSGFIAECRIAREIMYSLNDRHCMQCQTFTNQSPNVHHFIHTNSLSTMHARIIPHMMRMMPQSIPSPLLELRPTSIIRPPVVLSPVVSQEYGRHESVYTFPNSRIYSTKKEVQSQSQQPKNSIQRNKTAVRPVPIRIITVSSKKSSQSCVEEWTKKVSRYTQVETITMKPNPLKASDTAVAVKEEAKRICQKLNTTTSYVVCLDERGRDATSESFADLLVRVSDNGYSSLTCVVGGPFGLDQSVRDMADETVCLSKCVLNHSVAHIVLMEQLYRAWTIVKGEPYHH